MTRPPNLLFIFTDEQRLDTLACYGNEQIDMPHLNRFAESACVFDDPHCTQPVCTPSRGALMTGLYPHTHGAWENNKPLFQDARCLPELLDDQLREQYICGYHGKWHLGDEIFKQHGFDEWVSIEDDYIRFYSDDRDRDERSDYHHFVQAHGCSLGPGGHYSRGFSCQLPEYLGKPHFLGENASRFIRQNRDRPWMLCVNFLEPHMPFFGPRDGQYDPDEVPLPSNFDDVGTGVTYITVNQEKYRRHGFDGRDLATERGWRELISNYWGLNSLVDTHTGRILKTLYDCGLDDDTIVVFTSDHGEMMGSHRLIGKTVMYRESIRVPLIVRLPGQKNGCRITGPTSQIDLAPTLLELMGQSPWGHMHGRSLAGLLNEGAESGRDQSAVDNASEVVLTWDGGAPQFNHEPDWLAEVAGSADAAREAMCDKRRTLVSADGWRFTASPRGEHELYDYNTDPDERQNLATDPAHNDRMATMLDRIRAWQRKTDDQIELPDIV